MISDLIIEPLTPAQIQAMISWRYEGAYAVYNLTFVDIEAAERFFRDPQNGYFAILDHGGDLVAFCNFGADAQVPGGEYSEGAIDIGLGVRPDLTGQGQGAVYAGALLAFAHAHYPQLRQRVTIAEFNQRAQRLYSGLGFCAADRFLRESDGRPFYHHRPRAQRPRIRTKPLEIHLLPNATLITRGGSLCLLVDPGAQQVGK